VDAATGGFPLGRLSLGLAGNRRVSLTS